MRTRLALWTALVGLTMAESGGAAHAQQPSFRSGVQLLEVDARVFDRHGRFVTDLTLEDFEVLEQGVPQKIETFFLVGGASTPPVDALAAAPALPRAPHTWVFIFDHQHIRLNGFVRARRALEAFMSERFRAGDLAGIVMSGRMINNRISSVRGEFLAALAKVGPPFDAVSRAADQAEVALLPDDDKAGAHIKDVLETRNAREVERAVSDVLETLDTLAKGLAAMPGPKTTVLFSDGFSHPDYFNTLRTVVGRMNRAGARVYAIDTRGLAGRPSDMINSLAVDTGGMVIFNQNNIGRALDDVAADTNVYYVLGYQPVNRKYDGTYREIEVRVNRQDVKVRARKGHLALPPPKMNIPKPVR